MLWILNIIFYVLVTFNNEFLFSIYNIGEAVEQEEKPCDEVETVSDYHSMIITKIILNSCFHGNLCVVISFCVVHLFFDL